MQNLKRFSFAQIITELTQIFVHVQGRTETPQNIPQSVLQPVHQAGASLSEVSSGVTAFLLLVFFSSSLSDTSSCIVQVVFYRRKRIIYIHVIEIELGPQF